MSFNIEQFKKDKEKLDLLKDKALNCKNFEYKIIKNTGHTYKSKELEVANLIFDWINKNF